MPSSKFYCHPSEKGDAKKSSSHFSGLTFAEHQPHPPSRTNERMNEWASSYSDFYYVLLWQKEESWGKQPNSLNTRSKKAINLEAKWKIGPSEYLIQEKSQGCCSMLLDSNWTMYKAPGLQKKKLSFLILALLLNELNKIL